MIQVRELYIRKDKEQPTINQETSMIRAKSSRVKDRGNILFTGGCKRDKDGWAIDENGELLFWILPRNRSLRWPSNSRVIGEGETEIDRDDV